MGQQGSFGGSKPGKPPNPNYGSGGGVDNSNGVYNAGVATAAGGQTGTTLASPTMPAPTGGLTDLNNNAAGATGATGTTTATATLAPQGGYSPITPGNTKGQAGGNKAGQPPVPGYPTANNSMTTQAALDANQRPAEYSEYDGKDHTADKAAWDAWNAKQQAAANPAPAVPAGLPPGMAALAQNKMQSKGGQPPAAQGGMIGGMANATTGAAAGATGTTGAGPIDYAAQSGRFNAQNDPTGGYAKMYNQQQAGKAAVANAPDWMKGLMSGVGADKSTNESRAAADLAGNPIQTNKTYTNWESAVKAMTGQADPWKALSEAYKTAGAGQSAQMNQANIHRALLNSGINKETADRVHEMFASGTDHEGAARRLGITDKYLTFTGATQAQRDQASELAKWHAANRGTAPPPPGATGTPGATGATGTPEGTGATGAPGATGSTGAPPITAAPTITGVADADMPQGMDQNKLLQLSRSYGVTPQIALQIYKQMLGQSQSSGGGNSENPGSSGDGGDGV